MIFYRGHSVFLFFFFFQAEDGIRDKLVTGVQTCAVPILILRGSRGCRRAIDRLRWRGGARAEHHMSAERSCKLNRGAVQLLESDGVRFRRIAEIGRASCRERV